LKRRFYFGDENENEDEDENENEPFENPEFFQMAQFPLDSSEPLILDSAIKLCQSCLFWRFYSLSYKLKKIKETYDYFQSIIDEEIERKKNA
jgi:hypothetical protein